MANAPVKRINYDRRVAIARLKELLAQKRNDLTWHHEVGRLVVQLVPKDRAYGDKRMPNLLKELGLTKKPSTQVLFYGARDFALSYSEEDLQNLAGLKYGHISILVGIRKPRIREKFRRLCQERAWSMRELRNVVQEKMKRQPRGKLIKKADVQRIGTFTSLKYMLRLRDRCLNLCLPALEQNLESLAKRLRQQPGKWVELVGDACNALDELHNAVEKARTELREISEAG
jgi:hypothetical protein